MIKWQAAHCWNVYFSLIGSLSQIHSPYQHSLFTWNRDKFFALPVFFNSLHCCRPGCQKHRGVFSKLISRLVWLQPYTWQTLSHTYLQGYYHCKYWHNYDFTPRGNMWCAGCHLICLSDRLFKSCCYGNLTLTSPYNWHEPYITVPTLIDLVCLSFTTWKEMQLLISRMGHLLL